MPVDRRAVRVLPARGVDAAGQAVEDGGEGDDGVGPGGYDDDEESESQGRRGGEGHEKAGEKGTAGWLTGWCHGVSIN